MRTACLAAALLATSGCNSILGIGDLHLGDAPDAFGGDAPTCYGSLVAVCERPFPTPLDVTGAINTDDDPRCLPEAQSGGPSVCAIVAFSISVGAGTTVVTGVRPLVLVATSGIVIEGTLDASSTNGQIGAGADPTDCLVTAGMSGTYGGGGGGGSFGEPGAHGGTGAAGAGAAGGIAAAPIAATAVRGGCGGGAGGPGGGSGPGAGGPGGGAIYLVAKDSIRVSGEILASGGGGGGAAATSIHGGGGGGGSGGFIGLEAPTIDVTGQLVANGGAGGEGGDASSMGADGGVSAVFDVAAVPGIGTSPNGGDGGRGGALAMAPATGLDGATATSGGGGGGGGGTGVVWVKGAISGTQISPAPSVQ